MTDRTTKVSLTANVANFIAGMEAATASSAGVVDSLAKQKAAAVAAAEAQGAASLKIGKAFLAVGAVAAVAVGLAVKQFADFDAKMSQVATLSHATAPALKDLTDAALTAGQKIGFSASQVADAEIEMVKAGISVKDILGGALPGALQLAAAGQIDVASATEIATIAMTQFGLKGADIPHVADLLTAGADKALGGVQDLGEALKSGGLVAAQFGVSLDETVGTLSAFANAGLIGETAGTDLRQMLLKLANPSADSAKDLKNLGISIYDASGKFVGISALAGELKDKLSGLAPEARNAALATIFGSRAIAGANVLYKEGSAGITKWTNAVNDTGFASSQASGKMNNLEGDLKKLESAFQTSIIKSGSGANEVLRSITQGLTNVTSAVGSLPQPVLSAGLVLGGLVAAVGLVGGGALTVVPKIASFKAALVDLKISGAAAGGAIGKGSAILIGITAIASGLANIGSTSELSAAQLAQVDQVAKNLNDKDLEGMFKNATTAIVDSTDAAGKMREALDAVASGNFFANTASATKFIDGATLGLTHFSDVYKTNSAQFKELGVQLAGVATSDFPTASAGFAKLVKSAGGGREAIRELLDQMPEYKAELIKLAAAQGITLKESDFYNLSVGKGAYATILATGPAKKLAGTLTDVGTSAQGAQTKISDLADEISGFGKNTLDARQAQRDFQQAVDDAATALKTNGKSLDINTQAGRDNQAALDAIAQKANAAAAAIYTQTGNQDDATAVLTAGSAALYAAAAQYGLTGQAADDYVASVLATPTEIATTITADTTQASAAIDALQTKLAVMFLVQPKLPKGVTGSGVLLPQYQKAAGGILPGPPSAKDNLLVAMATGEGVATAKSMTLSKNRSALEYMNAGGDMAHWMPSVQAPPTYAPQPSASRGSSPVFNITEVNDPQGTAQAVLRRLNTVV